MQRLIVRRLVLMVPLMVGMTLISFIVSHSLPADPVGYSARQQDAVRRDIAQRLGSYRDYEPVPFQQ